MRRLISLRDFAFRILPCLLATTVLHALPATAQSSADFAGHWAVTWDAGIRTEGDRVLEVTRRLTSPLLLTAAGDSLIGTWQATPSSPLVPVHGTVSNGTLDLVADPREVTDQGRTFVVRLRFRGSVHDGTLSGTLLMQLDDRRAPLRRWEAVRVR